MTTDSDDDKLAEAVADEAQAAPLDEVIKALMSAKSEKNAKVAFTKVQQSLATLSTEELTALMDNDDFQSLVLTLSQRADKTAKPGTPMRDAAGRQIGKVPYTMTDVRKMFPSVTWVPTRTCSISYNGVLIFVRAFEEIESPACFRDIFFQSEKDTAQAFSGAPQVLRHAGAADGTSIASGWVKDTDAELEKKYGRQV